MTISITREKILAARDAALGCVAAAEFAGSNLRWLTLTMASKVRKTLSLPESEVSRAHAKCVAYLGDLMRQFEKANQLITRDLLDVIQESSAAAGSLKVVEIGGDHCCSFHSAAVYLLSGVLHSIAKPLSEMAKSECDTPDNLSKSLPYDPLIDWRAFWSDLASFIDNKAPKPPQEMRARIEREAAIAMAFLGQGGWDRAEENSHLSKPASPKVWAKRFGCSPKTFIARCDKKQIRHKKLSDRSYQVDTRDIPPAT